MYFLKTLFLLIAILVVFRPCQASSSCPTVLNQSTPSVVSTPEIFSTAQQEQIVELKVESESQPIEAPIFQVHGNELSQLQILNQKSQTLATSIQNVYDKKIETVVYPLPGYDASTAFLIFPQASTVIGIDMQPFSKAGVNSISAHLPKSNGNVHYTYHDEVKQVGESVGIAPALLARLKNAIPNFTPIRVVRYQEGESTHGWIDFNSGAGTPLRRYIHIHANIPLKENKPAISWIQRILKNDYQAILVKGALGLFDNPNPLEEANPLITHLIDSGGLVVDTDTQLVKESYLSKMVEKYPTYKADAALGYGSIKSENSLITVFPNKNTQ